MPYPPLPRALMFVLVINLLSCGRGLESDLTNVGFVPDDLNGYVLYLEITPSGEERVVLRPCVAATLPPLTRSCDMPADESEQSLPWMTYAAQLYLDLGEYQMEPKDATYPERLEMAQHQLASALASGNEHGRSRVPRLTQIRDNLLRIVALHQQLSDEQSGVTYYEFNDEFLLFLEPFAIRLATSNPNRLVPEMKPGTQLIFGRDIRLTCVDSSRQCSFVYAYIGRSEVHARYPLRGADRPDIAPMVIRAGTTATVERVSATGSVHLTSPGHRGVLMVLFLHEETRIGDIPSITDGYVRFP